MPMRMEFTLGQRLELKMKLAPQILQSIEILQLPTLELLQRIKQELVENPILEIDETKPEGTETSEAEATPAATEPQVERDSDGAKSRDGAEEITFESIEPFMSNWQDYGSAPSAARQAGREKDKKLEAMMNTAARALTLQDYLFNQFSLLDLDERQMEIGRNMIYNIDSDGYLRSSLEELFPPEESDVSVKEARKVLRMIQSLDPPGIGARDLQECLLLQIDDTPKEALARLLVSQHLEDIEKNRYPKMVRETGESLEAIKGAVEFITRLSPRPGALFSDEMPQYITPDVNVEHNDAGKYKVSLEDHRIPRLYISPIYAKLLQDENAGEEEREYVRKKILAARWLIDAIEQRRDTLLRICKDVFEIQRDFLDHGIKHLKPLKMRTVAEHANVHVSTVSRAIADKYAQTPRGIYPLKFFFTGGTKAGGGEMTSRKSVKQSVLEAIENEDKRNPLSDDEIARMLQQQGLDIARRTVSKYRKALRIPTSRRRRAY